MKKIVTILISALLSLSLTASPIGEKRAREIATNFFSSSTATRGQYAPSFNLAWSGYDMEQNLLNNDTRSAQISTNDDALLYIYNRTDEKGFVIVAGDDSAERAILAFSHDNTFDIENMAEGAKTILQSWCNELANGRTKSVTRGVTRATTGKVIVKYETAKWSQGAPYNLECPIIDGSRAVSGCVATAAAILFYYHRYPEKGVGETGEYSYTSGGVKRTIPNHTLGRTFEYDKMLAKYGSSYTTEQGAAVAALMFDIGTAIHISYGKSATSGNITRMARSLINNFGYAKDMLYIRRVSYEDSKWFEMLRENIDKYGPTYYRGETASGTGHAFLLDGYTDADYFSINYGHAGRSDGYYYLPNITYDLDQRAIFRMRPDKDGTSQYIPYLNLEKGSTTYEGIHTNINKYEVGVTFKCYLRIRNRGLNSFDGVYGVAHCDKNGTIKSVLNTVNRAGSPLTSEYYTTKSLAVTISQAIEDGDRLRVIYRAQNETEWRYAKKINASTTEEVIMRMSAEDVSKSLKFGYNKTTKTLYFTPAFAVQCTITNASGQTVATGSANTGITSSIDLSALASGEYNCAFAASGEPYSIKIKL